MISNRAPSRSQSLRIARSLTALVLGLSSVVVGACSSSKNDLALAELAEGCTINSDCESPLVCAFKTCHDKCEAQRDCPDGELCVASDKPFHVCQLPAEVKCTDNGQCAASEVCGADNHCRDACASGRDCIDGQSCVSGTCVDNGQPLVVVDASVDASLGTPCSYNSNCPLPLVCRAGMCAFDCLTSRDCASGESCVANACVAPGGNGGSGGGTGSGGSGDGGTSFLGDGSSSDGGPPGSELPTGSTPPGYGRSCALTSDCPSGLLCKSSACIYECETTIDCDATHGYCCAPWHACVTGSACLADAGGPARDAGSGAPCTNDVDCQDGLFCDGYERCVNGACANAVRSACDDQNPCTSDMCTEAGQKCSHVATGPQDVDHDGHYATSCGNGADDCDDTNPDIYTGHPEVCDYLDNNCNGAIDEGVWTITPPINFSTTSTNGVAPAVTALADGSFAVALAAANSSQSAIFAWHVPSTFAMVGALTQVSTGSSSYGCCDSGQSFWPNVATDGTNLLFGGLVQHDYTYGGDNRTYTSALGATTAALASPVETSLVSAAGQTLYSTSRPALSWVPGAGEFAAVWSDTHLGSPNSTATLFTAWVTTGGYVSGTHALLANQPDAAIGLNTDAVVTASQGRSTRSQLAVGGASILVGWTLASTGHARFALFDETLTSNIITPVDLSGTDEVLVEGAIYTGSEFVLLTSDATETKARVHRINATDGTVIASLGATGANTWSDFHVAAQGPGIAIDLVAGTELRYGWAPKALNVPFTFQEIGTGTSTPSGAALLSTDAKHALMFWSGPAQYGGPGTTTAGGMFVSKLACGT